MSDGNEISEDEVHTLYERLLREGKKSGYNLNPDVDFTKELLGGLLINQSRYGYGACPCRLASGNKAEDLDIICPCDYRDSDLVQYGACYCALYVSQEVLAGKKALTSIPERRPSFIERAQPKGTSSPERTDSFPFSGLEMQSLRVPLRERRTPGHVPNMQRKTGTI